MPPIASNRYELLDKIAKGGMAEVYRARRIESRDFNSLVAVKRILPERAEETGFVEMLIDEARITSQLRHPNIAQLFELACDNTGYFIVMELLLGPNLAALIDKLKNQGRGLPQACAVEATIQLLKALDYAHTKCGADGHPLNLVHRDISPDNLLLGPKGEVKLIDFGVAKAKDRLSNKTKAGMIKGKFSYLAPERLRSSISDPRSDLFSTALVLWEGLTGRIRFDAEDDRDLLVQIEKNSSPSFSEMGINIPSQLESILDKALATNPAHRYQTAAEFLDALERYQQRFNPGDNTALLGRLVATAFKTELRWLDDSIEKFRTGRLHPLGIIGGGIIEERFQISQKETTAQRMRSFRLKRPKMRRPTESPFEEVPYLDSPAQREATTVFEENGIKMLSDEDFDEDTSGATDLSMAGNRAAQTLSYNTPDSDEDFDETNGRAKSPKRLIPARRLNDDNDREPPAKSLRPKRRLLRDEEEDEETTSGGGGSTDKNQTVSFDMNRAASGEKNQEASSKQRKANADANERFTRDDVTETQPGADRFLLGSRDKDQRTKTRVFNFGDGASVKFTFSPKNLIIIVGAFIGGLILFAMFLNLGVFSSTSDSALDDDSGEQPSVATASSGSLLPTPPALPNARPTPSLTSAESAKVASPSTATTSEIPSAPVHSPSPEKADAVATSPVKSSEVPATKPAVKKAKPAKKSAPKKKAAKRKKTPKKAPASRNFSNDDDFDDDSFFQSDEETDIDLEEEIASSNRGKKKGSSRSSGTSSQSAQSAADDAFNDDDF